MYTKNIYFIGSFDQYFTIKDKNLVKENCFIGKKYLYLVVQLFFFLLTTGTTRFEFINYLNPSIIYY